MIYNIYVDLQEGIWFWRTPGKTTLLRLVDLVDSGRRVQDLGYHLGNTKISTWLNRPMGKSWAFPQFHINLLGMLDPGIPQKIQVADPLLGCYAFQVGKHRILKQ